MPESLGDIGEFGFIGRIKSLLTEGPDVLARIGDDCAAVRVGAEVILVSCDLSIENVHFRTTVDPEWIGYKAAASAWSDIFAMAGLASCAVVSIAAPPATPVEFLREVYRGLDNATKASGGVIVGGDTSRIDGPIVIDVTVIGRAIDGRFCTRRGANPGDRLLVIGELGTAALGLHVLEHNLDHPEFAHAHYHPKSRVGPGAHLWKYKMIRALIDVSDGLVQDAGHLANAAGLGVDIESWVLPINPKVASTAYDLGLDPVDLALYGGEDYALAVAVDKTSAIRLRRELQMQLDVPAAIVGAFTADFKGVRVDGAPPKRSGHDHFGKQDA